MRFTSGGEVSVKARAETADVRLQGRSFGTPSLHLDNCYTTPLHVYKARFVDIPREVTREYHDDMQRRTRAHGRVSHPSFCSISPRWEFQSMSETFRPRAS